MAYLDILFQNIQQGGGSRRRSDGTLDRGRIAYPNSRCDYTVNFPGLMNVCQRPAPSIGGVPPTTFIPATPATAASALWGPNITLPAGVAPGTIGGACGIFFSESSPYPFIANTHYHIGAWASINGWTSPPNWDPPASEAGWWGPMGWNPPPGYTNTPIPAALPYGWAFNSPPMIWASTPPPVVKWPITGWNAPATWNMDARLPGGTIIPPMPASPAVPDLTPLQNSFIPFISNNHVCAFLEGLPDSAPPGAAAPQSLYRDPMYWLPKSNPNCALKCVGTGDPNIYNGAAPTGSDRYALYFEATNRTYPAPTAGQTISGVFVHVKNTNADEGTQLVSLTCDFPHAIIFGDLNFNIRERLSFESFQKAISSTHTILALQQGGGFYITHGGNAAIDFALIPNAFVPHVELWGYQAGAAPVLSSNGSDHSMLMLRIHCN